MLRKIRELVWSSPIPALRWRHADREFRDLARSLGPADTAIDGGASLGLCTFRLARAVGPGGRVIAFEPHEGSADRLARHVKLRGLGWVEIERRALSADSGIGRLCVPIGDDGREFPPLGVLSDEPRPGETAEAVRTVSLDGFAESRGLSGVRAVKLDLEGGEFDAIMGARGLIERCRPELLLEVESRHLERFGRTPAELFELLRGLGYGEPVAVGGRAESVNRRFSPAGGPEP